VPDADDNTRLLIRNTFKERSIDTEMAHFVLCCHFKLGITAKAFEADLLFQLRPTVQSIGIELFKPDEHTGLYYIPPLPSKERAEGLIDYDNSMRRVRNHDTVDRGTQHRLEELYCLLGGF